MSSSHPTAQPHASAPPRHIYIHVPFCVDRCTYCAFVTVTENSSLHDGFVSALLEEWARTEQPATVDTLYLGGGTPAQLDAAQLRRILQQIRRDSTVPATSEVTLEANPANIDERSLEAWWSLGINRLSIGVQTLDTAALSRFGRHHDGEDAQRALSCCAENWPGTWSADLLVGWGGQTEPDVSRDTSTLIDCGAPHISVYGLTVEPGTPLAKQYQVNPKVIGSHSSREELDLVWSSILSDAGFERYEVSNFARPGHRSRHNEAYWRCADYLGLGPGATTSWGGWRWTNEPSLRRWSERCRDGRSVRQRCERLDREARLLEVLAVGLRTSDGVPWSRIHERFGLDARTDLEHRLTPLVSSGHLCLDDEGLRVSSEHLIKVDHLVSRLLGEPLDTPTSPP